MRRSSPESTEALDAIAHELLVRETLEGAELETLVREHSGSFPAATGPLTH
jgi:hypothetical protein